MRRLNHSGHTLTEAVTSLVLLGVCALLISQLVSNMANNTTSIRTTRGLYNVMQNTLETYQIDVTRSRDLGHGSTILTTQYNNRTVLSEVVVHRGVLGNTENIYIINIKTYYKDRPKHFIGDTVVITKGIGLNAA